jgi:hypothetical protein
MISVHTLRTAESWIFSNSQDEWDEVGFVDEYGAEAV